MPDDDLWQFMWGTVMSFCRKAFIGPYAKQYVNPLFGQNQLISDLARLDLV